jgi:hypothetical protein
MDPAHCKVPKGYLTLRYQTKPYDERIKSLSVFTEEEHKFLERYLWLRQVPEFFKPGDLFCVMNNVEVQKEAEQKLQNFQVDNKNVRCPDASTLQTLIPYVKRLVRLFPDIMENSKNKSSSPHIRKNVYQYETLCSVRKIDQSVLDFDNDVLGLTEFLNNERKFWQLRMTDGDAWTGITKVYRVLHNTPCTSSYSSEGHYTILDLERLLTVNQTINLNALLAEMETPHLLMIACGNNQTVNDELRNIFKKLFSILENKKVMKVILTTQSEGSTSAILQQIASEILGKGMQTTDESLSWN